VAGVKGVFIADDYITVTKKEDAEWRGRTVGSESLPVVVSRWGIRTTSDFAMGNSKAVSL